ncbi:hypothetical protein K1T71_010167 [Dendrolimus kikuchii]|uniref:Uncharacterized protein n=1 Tax=Dendrolimus kikuchii TaxID=765133 RepID=A0ACC1CR66_9NEOP|nr:hypothetical protein K1T71_010167 [Dendrolimus kikuchii]
MLTADELPTKGKVMANRLTIKDGKEKYMRALGYCPQFFGIDEFLTGKQILEITLTLRGFYPRDIVTETKNWIDIVGLQKYAKRLTSSYSGGCKRRIATAVAMCGEAPVALLDEPTAGVDVAARRKVWAALRRGLLQGRSIIITSHR